MSYPDRLRAAAQRVFRFQATKATEIENGISQPGEVDEPARRDANQVAGCSVKPKDTLRSAAAFSARMRCGSLRKLELQTLGYLF